MNKNTQDPAVTQQHTPDMTLLHDMSSAVDTATSDAEQDDALCALLDAWTATPDDVRWAFLLDDCIERNATMGVIA